MKTLKEYLTEVSIRKVFDVLFDENPDQICNVEGYASVVETLMGMEPTPTTDICKFRWQTGFNHDDKFIDIVSVKENESTMYALDFTPWAEWLGMRIENSLNLSDEHIVAYILYELTFYGFTDRAGADLQEKLKQITQDIEDALKRGPNTEEDL